MIDRKATSVQNIGMLGILDLLINNYGQRAKYTITIGGPVTYVVLHKQNKKKRKHTAATQPSFNKMLGSMAKSRNHHLHFWINYVR